MESILHIRKKNTKKVLVIDLNKLITIVFSIAVFATLITILIVAYTIEIFYFQQISTALFIVACTLFIKLKGQFKTYNN